MNDHLYMLATAASVLAICVCTCLVIRVVIRTVRND